MGMRRGDGAKKMGQKKKFANVMGHTPKYIEKLATHPLMSKNDRPRLSK